MNLKQAVLEFWDAASCGEEYATGEDMNARLSSLRRVRYQLEPYIPGFANFPSGRDRDVLEVGVGMGCDHLEWAKGKPSSLSGIDLTRRGIDFTRQNLASHRLTSSLCVADAENLPFGNAVFDIVYSWGVLHVSPDPPRAVQEVFRVLRPGGTAKIMIYHKYSLVGYMLWLRYGLLALRPWRSLRTIYARYLESPGMQAYSLAEARNLFLEFSELEMGVQLGFADLLLGEAGQRHQGILLTVARALWPRRLIQRWFARHGLFLLITARK